jgi:NitT/TauT family transport system permease protein
LLIWQISVNIFSVPDYTLPAPLHILEVFKKSHLLLFENSLVTLKEILVGFFFGISLGFILALVMFLSKFFYNTLYPLIIISQTIPKLALAPLFLIWFGYGFLPKVLITTLIVLFPVLVNTIKGMASVHPGLLDFMHSLQASKIQILLKVRIPSAIPYIFAGVKVSITLAVVGAVIGEFIGADKGLGFVIMSCSVNLNTGLMFSALISLSIIGLFLFGLICLLERLAVTWYTTGSGDDKS